MVQIVNLNKFKNNLKKKDGFTFVEVLVAMFVFALILAFMLQSTLLAYKINLSKQVKSMAIEIAQEELEKIRNMPYDKIYDADDNGSFDDTTYKTDCPEPCTTTPTNNSCKLTRNVLNSSITFGKSVKVEPDSTDSNIAKITLTVCSDFKDWRTKQPIEYTVTTIISNAGD